MIEKRSSLKAAIYAVLGRSRIPDPPMPAERAGTDGLAAPRRPAVESKTALLAERQVGVQAERARIAALLSLPEAQHNWPLAVELALGGLSESAVRRVLQSAGRVRTPYARYEEPAMPPRAASDDGAVRAADLVAVAERCSPLDLAHWRNRGPAGGGDPPSTSR